MECPRPFCRFVDEFWFTHEILLFPTSLCGGSCSLFCTPARPPARPPYSHITLSHTALSHTSSHTTYSHNLLYIPLSHNSFPHTLSHTQLWLWMRAKRDRTLNHWFPYLEGRGKACCCHLWFSLILGKLLHWAVIVGYTVSVPIGHGWLTDIHILPDPGQVRQTNPLPNCNEHWHWNKGVQHTLW